MRSTLFWAILAVCTILPPQSRADNWKNSSAIDLTALSLEELINVEVTLASRKEGNLFETAAAVFVLTGDDLRRAGVTSIPEALRLVPGMQVGHIDASKWAVSARGFNDRFAQKLLVLIDGRNVYSPLFSGVFWEVRDTMLEDVERIEVIRGPGATLWGANAVNGIINIVTYSAAATQGGLVKSGSGSQERGFANLRYGGSLNADTHYRVYSKYFARDAFVDAAARPTADAWHMLRGGFRIDWTPEGRDGLTGQGDLFDGKTGQTWSFPTLESPFLDTLDTDTQWSGGYLLARWNRTFSTDSNLRLQLYYDRKEYKDLNSEVRDTYDLDFQHRFSRAVRHDIVWGAGYRFTTDATKASFNLSFDPARRGDHLFSAFAQDEIALVPHRLSLSLGSKFEHNDYTGFEYQPNVRLLWKPRLWHALWAAVSRAVRTPARADDDVRIVFRTFPAESVFPGIDPDTPPFLNSLLGNRSFESEKLISYEAGYRMHPHPALFFDLATFYNNYDDLRAAQNAGPLFQADAEIPHFAVELLVDNLMRGTTYGGELAIEWQFPEYLGRLRGAYSYLKMDLRLEPNAHPESATAERGSPRHQLYVWPSFNLRPRLQLDAIGRYVSRIADRDEDNDPAYVEYFPQRDIAAYFELDLRLAWQPTRRLELALVGRNLLDDHHPEFVDFLINSLPTETQRGIYGAATWKF